MSARKYLCLALVAIIALSCGFARRTPLPALEPVQVVVSTQIQPTETPLLPTSTPEPTAITAPSPTAAPTQTDLPAGVIDPAELVLDEVVYAVTSVELTSEPPDNFEDYVNTQGGYYLYISFDCTGKKSLTSIYLNSDMTGITFNAYDGLPNISLIDTKDTILAISLGDCLLGFPVAQYDSHTWELQFMEADPIAIIYPIGAAVVVEPSTTREPGQQTQSAVILDGILAFTSEMDGDADIYTMEYDGSNYNQLTNDPALDYKPAWSPDGEKIAFVSERDGEGNGEVYVMNADGGDPVNLTKDAAYDGAPAWSPDGTTIAFYSDRDGDYELYLMDPDGGNIRQVTDNDSGDCYPSWSPDSNKLAFHSNEDEDNWDVYVINLDGTERQRFTSNPSKDFLPAWSPDGTKILFWSERDDVWQVYVMDAADGQNKTQVTTDDYLIDKWISRPAWAPQGFAFAVAIEYGYSQQVMVFPGWGEDWEFFTSFDSDSYDPAWWYAP